MKSCPQCHLLLEPACIEGVEYFVCRGCGGSWHTTDTVPILFSADRALLASISIQFPGIAASGMYDGLRVNCPDCRVNELITTARGEAPDYPLFTCPRCEGLWLRVVDRSALISRKLEGVSVESANAPLSATGLPSAPTMSIVEVTSIVPPLPEILTASRVDVRPEISASANTPTGDQSPLERLMAGNRRFTSGSLLHPNQSRNRLAEIRQMQKPFAIIVGCADSRAVPEIVFDQGLGDLFTIRNAGNIVTDLSLDSIEFVVEELGASLVMVLGHAQCAAVIAAVEGKGKFPALADLAEQMLPAVEIARTQRGELVDNAIKANAVLLAGRLRRFLYQWIKDGRVDVAAGYYDLDSGIVELLQLENDAVDEKSTDLAESQSSAHPSATAQSQEPTGPLAGLLQQVGATVSQFAKGIAGSGDPSKQESIGTVNVVAAANSRWCPQCRKRFDSTKMFCPDCSIGLAEAGYRTRCLKCNRENPIGNDHCWQCGVDLHPA